MSTANVFFTVLAQPHIFLTEREEKERRKIIELRGEDPPPGLPLSHGDTKRHLPSVDPTLYVNVSPRHRIHALCDVYLRQDMSAARIYYHR